MKYAFHSSAEFQKTLRKSLLEISLDTQKALGTNLVALILGGGYGRGEGGLVVENGIEKPYNDLDFTLVVARKDANIPQLLSDVRKKWSEKLKIHVDFSTPLSIDDIKNFPHKLMWQDLLNGHEVLFGDKQILFKNCPASLSQNLPIIEATHLLLNRGAGLIWSNLIQKGIIQEDDHDFIRRNYYKAALAIGDALLIAQKRHQTAYRGRDKALQSLKGSFPDKYFAEVFALYSSALEFKFRPDNFSTDLIAYNDFKRICELLATTFLMVEQKRTGVNFDAPKTYYSYKQFRQKDENCLKKFPRNLYYNIREAKISFCHPREWLFRILPIILLKTLESDNVKNLTLSKKFLRIWQKYN